MIGINYLVQNAIDDIIFVVRNLIVGIKKHNIVYTKIKEEYEHTTYSSILPSSQAVRQQILILCIVCSSHISVAIKIKKELSNESQQKTCTH